jgi:hypothetical protein
VRIATACVCCSGEALSHSPAILMPFVANRVFGWEPVAITPDWGLRTIPTGLAYSLCNSLQCDDCGLTFLDMRFDEDEMAALYDGYRGPAYAKQRERFEPGYLAHNADILGSPANPEPVEAFLTPLLPAQPTVLDWGGDTGLHTPFRTAIGDIWVHDISGRPLIDGVRMVGKTDLQEKSYDLVVLSHVLEHMPWPAALLDEVKTVMSPATVLYVEVPLEALIADDPASPDLATRKKYWHEHVNFFTEAALRRLLARSGMRIVDFQIRERGSHANFDQVLAFACRRDA